MLRYSLIRYLYSAYFEVTQQGGTLMRPLFYQWQDNEDLYVEPGSHFMLGSAIMVVPVLYPKNETKEEISIYFPQVGTWLNLANGAYYKTS